MNSIGDFHIHSQYCPHGTNDSMESYVKAAIKKNLKYITFTEHAPLPKEFNDPTPERDSAMQLDDVDNYLKEGMLLKEKYKHNITVNIGFEIDYIEGFESELDLFFENYKQYIPHSILSVHMLKAPNGEYVCIDFSAEEFGRIISLFGSVEAVYDQYYRTMKQAILTNFKNVGPNRIGHLTLINKFAKLYPAQEDYKEQITNLLNIIKQQNYVLDANSAGLFKQHCQESYPNQSIMRLANELNIPLIYGSDSHTAKHVGRGLDHFDGVYFSLPTN